MKILIAGAGGLLGQAFTRYYAQEHHVLPLTHSELDITDASAVNRLTQAERPALIINCVVLGVDTCELEPGKAWAVNVIGAENLARAATASEAEMLHFSTNFVYDGKRANGDYYTVVDTPDPINVYGQTKLAGEQAVRTYAPRSFIVRTSWVFGPGKVNFFSNAHRSLQAGQPLRAITDVWANTTYARDLVGRVAEILPRRHYATYHLVNSGLCSYYEFVVEAARLLEIPAAQQARLIEPVKLAELSQPAARPRYTPMRCLVSDELGLAPLRNWRLALAEYIHQDHNRR